MDETSKLRLRITAPDGSKQILDLSGTSFEVGSGDDAAIHLDDPRVADQHALLTVKEGRLVLSDIDPDGGATLDGEEVEDEAILAPGQKLVLGETTLELLGEGSQRKFEKGGKGKGKGRRSSSPRAQLDGGSAATEGNAARALHEEVPADEKPTIIEPLPNLDEPQHRAAADYRSVLDIPRESRPLAPDLGDAAVRFLADELPESLRPTPEEKRLQVALVWGRDQFLDVKDVLPGKTLTIGESHEAHLAISGVPGVAPFVQPQADGFRLLLPRSSTVRLRRDGREITGDEFEKLDEASEIDVPVRGTAFEIGLDDRVNVDIGNLQLIARYTRPQAAKSRPFAERIDMNFVSMLLILLLAAVAFQRMIAITDFSDYGLTDDLLKNKDQFAKYIAEVEKKQTHFKDLSGVKAGEKAKDKEGKFGKLTAKQKEAAPSKKGAPVVDVNKREEDRKKVMKSGLLALLNGQNQGAVSNIFGPGGVGTGLNDSLGGRDGAAGMGDANGVGGLGSRGSGSGGGGNGLGIGGLGGHGGGRGRGGNGAFDLGGRGKSRTRFIPGRTTVLGGLTADEVGRIVRRHWNEMKYCYEKELNKDPNLAGTVKLAWVINPVGFVASAQIAESSLNNANAEACMVANVRRWKFPAPRGGGIVNVTYPFSFVSE